MCGGTSFALWAIRTIIGLSPRVRGNLRIHKTVKLFVRSIPACAGEPTERAGLRFI